jgi:hypothetical protein
VRGVRVWARLLGVERTVVEDVCFDEDAVVVAVRLVPGKENPLDQPGPAERVDQGFSIQKVGQGPRCHWTIVLVGRGWLDGPSPRRAASAGQPSRLAVPRCRCTPPQTPGAVLRVARGRQAGGGFGDLLAADSVVAAS